MFHPHPLICPLHLTSPQVIYPKIPLLHQKRGESHQLFPRSLVVSFFHLFFYYYMFNRVNTSSKKHYHGANPS